MSVGHVGLATLSRHLELGGFSDVTREQHPLSGLFRAGAGIACSASGTALGLLLGGPVGAAAGGALEWVGLEFQNRFLVPRERARVGAVLAFAIERLDTLTRAGEKIREDGFFLDEVAGSAGAEIIEGVLLAAQRDQGEKKTRFYGNLLAAIATTPDIDRGLANLLLRRAQQLSYRQLCLLAIVQERARYPLRDERLRPLDTSAQRGVSVKSGPTSRFLIDRALPNPTGTAGWSGSETRWTAFGRGSEHR